MNDVARINSFLGATKPLYDAVWQMIENANLTQATILDVGCGNGDFARRLVCQGRRKGIDLRVWGIDISALHLSIAREMTPSEMSIEFVQGDAFALPFEDGGVDIITSTLFLHHFRAPQIGHLLGEFCRVARLGWVMNDCARDAVALWSFRMLRPYLARSFVTRFDAVASIRRSYTHDELRDIVSPTKGAEVKSYFPYRLQAEWNNE